MRIVLSYLLALMILVTPALPAWSITSPVYTVAIDAEFLPYEYQDSVGRPAGFTVALLEEIGRRAGVTFRFEAVSWPEAVAGLESGRFDLVNMIQTPERREKYELSVPHSQVAQAIFSRKGAHDLSLEKGSFAGHSLTMQKGDISLEEIQKRDDFSKISLQLVQSKDTGFLLLESGKTDYFLAAEQPGIWLIQKFDLKNVTLAATNLFPKNYGFAARKGHVELISLLNLQLKSILASKEYQDLVRENILPVPQTSWFARHQSGIMVFIVLLLVAVTLSQLWILSLRHAVKMRTEQALLNEERFRSLFLHLPISVWEEDFSGVKREFDRLRAEGVTNFRTYFIEHPEQMELCASRITVLAINNESAEVFGVDDAAELLTKPLDFHFSEESWLDFREELVALAEGKKLFTSEVTIRDFRGNLRTLIMKLSVDPAHNDTLARVLVSFLDITERQKTKNELIRLKKAVETSSEIIFTADCEGIITYVNPSFTMVYGYRPEEVVGLVTPRILKSGAMSTSEYEQMWQRLLDKKGIKREFINKTRDGKLLTIENAVNPVLDDEGNITGYISIQSDISERKRIEKKLLESEERTNALLEAIPDAIFLKDGSGRWLMINAAANKLFTIGVLDYVNKSDSELAELVPGRREQLLYCMTTDEQAWKNGKLTRFEECVSGDNGTLHYFETIKLPIFMPDGARHRLVIVGRDITDRREMEAKILQAQNEWVETFDTINDAITIHDLDFNVIRANESAKKLLGMPGETVMQHQCFSAFHCADNPIAGCPALQTLQSGVPTVAELFEPKLGKYLEVRAIPRRNAAGEIDAVIHVVRDISERRLLEEQIIQQQKLEGIGLLAGGIAHDFNNLLTPIFGYTDMILMDADASAKILSRAAIILESAEKAKVLISQLLAFSRKQVMAVHSYDLNEIIQSFTPILKRTIRESIDIRESLCSEECQVVADRTQMEQILLNLAVNAQDAINGSGRIVIETGHVMLDDEYTLHHPGSRPGRYIMLTVTDNGSGMDDATLAHIFDPFFTTKAVGHGTGLGLSTVYGIVKQHEGYIDVQSRPGSGTAFRIYIPEQVKDSTKNPAVSTQNIEHGQVVATILLVEDNQTVLEVVREILTQKGHTVLCAALPEEALTMAAQSSTSIDLLITDVVMPEMNGTELYERMQQVIPQLKVLFMSGYANQMNVHHGTLEEGANFIAKPFTTEKFIERVSELL